MRTPRRQRAHDVVVKSVGRAGDSRARGRRGLDGRGRRRADRAMGQPVGRRPTADRCRRGADRGIAFSFLSDFVCIDIDTRNGSRLRVRAGLVCRPTFSF